MACKKLPARTLAGTPIDGERNKAEISYFASTLKERAAFWFNGLTIEVDLAVISKRIGKLAALCTAFEAQYLFDAAKNRGICLNSLKQKK